MPLPLEIVKAIGIVLLAVVMVAVLILRRRSQSRFYDDFADREVCEHLRPALAALKARGVHVRRAGQQRPDLPLEIHMAAPFDPNSLAHELKLNDPVFVSDRDVLYCRQDWCEIHPAH